MYLANVFTLSDFCQFSRSEYINFNYIEMNKKRMKLTVPVSSHALPINETKLADWDKNKKKLWNALQTAYGRAPYFGLYKEQLRAIFMEDYTYLSELNIELIKYIKEVMGFETSLIEESTIIKGKHNPVKDIEGLCDLLMADVYVSGVGAKAYMTDRCLEPTKIVWSNYRADENELSVLHYLFKFGAESILKVFEEWRCGLNGI